MLTPRRFHEISLNITRLVFLFVALSIGYANFGQDEVTRHIPLLHSANDSFKGVLRFINHSKGTHEVSIVGYDDEGTEYGPATFVLGSQDNKLIYAGDLENGRNGIEDGLGRGIGSWRLDITTSGSVEVNAYFEASAGLLKSLQETVQGENGCWRVPMFYSRDKPSTSKLRITNPGAETANIKISGRDDEGVVSATNIELTIESGVSKSFTATQLEGGTDDFTGSLGNGSGNWQLAVQSDRLITVMNLIEGSESRYMSNVSMRPSYALGHCWLGKTLANADRSIGDLISYTTIGNRVTDIQPAPLTPAIYAAIVDETGVRAIAAEGEKKAGSDIKASIHDRLHLGSITKPMTATMIATLVYDDESVFSNGWDTTIQDVFGNHVDEIHESYHQVRLKDILTHQGGIQSRLPKTWTDDTEATIIERRLSAALATIENDAGIEKDTVSYSHAGYVVAAAMVEKLTGRPWETEMQERLFQPLGMASAGFGQPALIEDQDDEPWGHTLTSENVWEPTLDDWHVVYQPTMGVHSSLEDLAKFVQLWMDDKEPMLLNRDQLQAITRLAVTDEGTIARFSGSGGSPSGGWWLYVGVLGYGEALNTPGSNGNWHSLVWILRDISRAYLVVTNSTLPTDRFDPFATINNTLTPIFDRLATSPARSSPPTSNTQATN